MFTPVHGSRVGTSGVLVPALRVKAGRSRRRLGLALGSALALLATGASADTRTLRWKNPEPFRPCKTWVVQTAEKPPGDPYTRQLPPAPFPPLQMLSYLDGVYTGSLEVPNAERWVWLVCYRDGEASARSNVGEFDSDGDWQIITPVPEPSAYVSLIVGAIALLALSLILGRKS